ncbi:MAG: dethiobiotin synthase [Acidobacteriia bacterium]|nr:dethiobiotin synthase [Terriglobia bacterium]
MLRGLFVTGTDTGIGKTVTCAALLHRYRQVLPLRYWKPVQTGIEQDDDTAEVRRLGVCRDDEVFAEGIRLPRPVSPHLAARWSGRTIAIEELTGWTGPGADAARWIVEGAGGALVPLNDSALMTDLMQALALPVLVVARSGLGTINHTLLTLEALRARSLRIAGVVMAGDKDAENRAAIEHYGDVAVVGEMPNFQPLDAGALGEWACAELDPQARLLDLLQ